MSPRNPLITSKVSGRAAYMPLPHMMRHPSYGILYAARDPYALWAPGSTTVEALGTSRGTIVPLTSPQAYQAASRLKHPLQYAWQSADPFHVPVTLASLFITMGLAVLPLGVYQITGGDVNAPHPDPLDTLLILSIMLLTTTLGFYLSTQVLPRAFNALKRLLTERPLIMEEYRSLQEAVALFPSSPLASLYAAWQAAPDEATRKGVEEIWDSVHSEERLALLRGQRGEWEQMEEALQEEARGVLLQEEARERYLASLKAEALSSARPLLPLTADPSTPTGLPQEASPQDRRPSAAPSA